MVHARHRPGPPHRRPGPLPAPVDRAAAWRMVRAARAEGLPVTAEATPHHFTLTDAACAVLRRRVQGEPAAAHRRRRRRRARPGWPTAPSTPSPPTTRPTRPHLKEQPFDQAPPGMLGLETALALALTELDLPIEQVLALLSWQPAAIAGIDDRHGGPVAAGRPANLCVIDPAATWVVEPAELASRARNTPYAGRTLHGPGAPHAAAGRARGRRRRGPPMSSQPRRAGGAARAGRRHHLRGRGHRRRARRAAWPAARSCSTPCCPATRRSSPTRPTPARSSPSPTPTSATTA